MDVEAKTSLYCTGIFVAIKQREHVVRCLLSSPFVYIGAGRQPAVICICARLGRL